MKLSAFILKVLICIVLLVLFACDSSSTEPKGDPPVASFSANEDENNILLWHFDASESYDPEDSTNIEFRWDLNGDGVWETGWLREDTIKYEYNDTENLSVILKVRDKEKLESQKLMNIIIFNIMLDIDGNIYREVRIGDQYWMAENLKVTRYRNGDLIQSDISNNDWGNLASGALSIYNNDSTNVETYGLLYNWFVISDNRNIAPEGYHVSSDDEWKELEMYLGMNQIDTDNIGLRGTTEGSKLKEQGTNHWVQNNGAINSSGFTALPSGFRQANDGRFINKNFEGNYWTTTTDTTTSNQAASRTLSGYNEQVTRYFDNFNHGLAIRCVRD